MIFFGIIAKNFFGELTANHYPNEAGDWIRALALSLILMRGGHELEFRGKGLLVIVFTILPQLT